MKTIGVQEAKHKYTKGASVCRYK